MTVDEPSPNEVVAVLLDMPLSNARRAVDMQIFDFGGRVHVVNRRGEDRTIGELRLHIQSEWRMIRDGVTFVTYHDILKPPADAPASPFDPDTAIRTPRDELLERFIEQSTADELTVTAATVTGAGALRLVFRGGVVLEVDAAAPGSDREAWRFLLPDGTHAVMGNPGFTMDRLPAT
jgi:hypothetical protein